MATAETSRSRRLAILGPVAVLVIGAVALGVVMWSDRAPEVATEPDPVEVDASSAYDFATIEEMVAASDLVVRAQVVATARGELLGADGTDPASTGLVVRDVTLEIDDVLRTGDAAGGMDPGGLIVVAEEGWLTTGEPLIVDGLGPSRTGDDGIWFLQAIPRGESGPDADASADTPGYLVINSQGRYLVDGGRLTGTSGDDPLVAEIESMSPAELAAALRA